MEGRVWVEDEKRTSNDIAGNEKRSKVLTEDKGRFVQAWKYHMLEEHRGNMWLSLGGVVSSHSVMATGLVSKHVVEFGTLRVCQF